MLAAALLTLASSLSAPSPHRSDEPFADLGYDEALALAVEEDKLLLVDFTAVWCQPCKRMEKDTWGDEGVRAWLEGAAVAIQVDVDEQPALAQRFQIKSMPTVVAVREGEVFDRIVGYRDAKAFLAWGADVEKGVRSTDTMRERSHELESSTDVDARRDLARDLLALGLYDEALVHYLWSWPASRGVASYGGVRNSFMVGEIARLIAAYEPAREAFHAMLEDLEAKVHASPIPPDDDWGDWLHLCGIFDENERIVAWYEKRRDDEGRLFTDVEVGDLDRWHCDDVVDSVFGALIDAGRPYDALALYGDPLERAESLVEDFESSVASLDAFSDSADAEELPGGDMREEMTSYWTGQLYADMGELYAALVLTERDEEASAVAEILLDALDEPDARTALVRAELEIGRASERCDAWLDEAEAAGTNVRVLRRRLEKLRARDEKDR